MSLHPDPDSSESVQHNNDNINGGDGDNGDDGEDINSPSLDCYSILDVPRSASFEDLKRAYKRQALSLHPDKPSGSVAQFTRLCRAYNVLSDPAKRRLYDQEGSLDSVRILEDASVRCRLETHFRQALEKTLGANQLVSGSVS